jgi:hypothetical protein
MSLPAVPVEDRGGLMAFAFYLFLYSRYRSPCNHYDWLTGKGSPGSWQQSRPLLDLYPTFARPLELYTAVLRQVFGIQYASFRIPELRYPC